MPCVNFNVHFAIGHEIFKRTLYSLTSNMQLSGESYEICMFTGLGRINSGTRVGKMRLCKIFNNNST